jgi:hypothetical protein
LNHSYSYVLVASVDPPIVLVHREGMARLCAER